MTSLVRILATFFFLAAPAAMAQTEDVHTVEGFPDFRQEVLDHMSSATKRLWVVTDYLTDGDIVAALYIAKYRKIDVQVLLGRAKANAYMSRLSYLKGQSIPVFLKPDTLKIRSQTAILADDSLLFAEGNLDFLTRTKNFKTSYGSEGERQAFVTAYAEAAALKMPANARQVPLVGRPPKAGWQDRPMSAPQLAPESKSLLQPGTRAAPHPTTRVTPPRTQESKTNDTSEVYHYKRTSDPRPTDVPSRLPKGLKRDKQAARDKSMMTKPALPAPRADGG